MEASDLAILKVLRCLRAVKPIRFLTRIQGLKTVFRAMIMSLASMTSVRAWPTSVGG